MRNKDFDSLRDQLGRRITQLRADKEIGLRKFAVLALMEHSQLSKIEKGKLDIKLATILKISTAFGIEIKELFDFSSLEENAPE